MDFTVTGDACVRAFNALLRDQCLTRAIRHPNTNPALPISILVHGIKDQGNYDVNGQPEPFSALNGPYRRGNLRLTCGNPGGAEGIRTPDPLDANEVRYRTAPQPLRAKFPSTSENAPRIREWLNR